MTEEVIISVVFRVKPEHATDFGSRLNALVESCRAEPGCLNFDVHHLVDDQTVWLLYEGWRSHDDLNVHRKRPEIQALRKSLDDILVEPRNPLHLVMTSKRT